jgi:hypothetical protein
MCLSCASNFHFYNALVGLEMHIKHFFCFHDLNYEPCKSFLAAAHFLFVFMQIYDFILGVNIKLCEFIAEMQEMRKNGSLFCGMLQLLLSCLQNLFSPAKRNFKTFRNFSELLK